MHCPTRADGRSGVKTGPCGDVRCMTAFTKNRHSSARIERLFRANNGRERVQQWMHQKAGYWITSSARASLAAAPAIVS